MFKNKFIILGLALVAVLALSAIVATPALAGKGSKGGKGGKAVFLITDLYQFWIKRVCFGHGGAHGRAPLRNNPGLSCGF